MTDDIGEKLARVQESCLAILDHARRARGELSGVEAILRARSEFSGRRGIITDVAPDALLGLRALLMILRADGTAFLNSRPDTRTYWDLSSLSATGRRIADWSRL